MAKKSTNKRKSTLYLALAISGVAAVAAVAYLNRERIRSLLSNDELDDEEWETLYKDISEPGETDIVIDHTEENPDAAAEFAAAVEATEDAINAAAQKIAEEAVEDAIKEITAEKIAENVREDAIEEADAAEDNPTE